MMLGLFEQAFRRYLYDLRNQGHPTPETTLSRVYMIKLQKTQRKKILLFCPVAPAWRPRQTVHMDNIVSVMVYPYFHLRMCS